jgi:hypothetical protein
MPSCEMWRRVDLVGTDVPAKCRFTRRHIPEDGILHSHHSENLNSYVYFE